MAFNLKKLVNKGLRSKQVQQVPWKKVNKIAKVAGPVVATVYPPAAPAVAGAMALSKMAEQGSVGANGKIAAVQFAAATGSPTAMGIMGALQTAQSVKKHQKGSLLLSAAAGGNPFAMQQIQAIKAASKMGDPKAMAALTVLKNVTRGRKYYGRGYYSRRR